MRTLSPANEFETRHDEGVEYPQGLHRLSTNYPHQQERRRAPRAALFRSWWFESQW